MLGLLQWGRDRLIAEMRFWTRLRRHSRRLQWGRDRLIAEMLPWMVQNAPFEQLQWGRDRLIAEIRARFRRRRRAASFNGAAID